MLWDRQVRDRVSRLGQVIDVSPTACARIGAAVRYLVTVIGLSVAGCVRDLVPQDESIGRDLIVRDVIFASRLLPEGF